MGDFDVIILGIVKQIKLLNFNKSLQKVNVFFYAYIEISLRSITS